MSMKIKLLERVWQSLSPLMLHSSSVVAVTLTCGLLVTVSAFALEPSRLSVSLTSDNTFVATIDHAFHLRYGCMYPLTYQFDIPPSSTGLKVERKFLAGDDWESLPEKSAPDFFNAMEVVRFDHNNDKAYVSVAFSSASDSVLIRISDSLLQPVASRFDGICKYYDNRTAAVTVSADDWSDWVVLDGRFTSLIDLFRSYHLYVTVGIITAIDYSSRGSWSRLQQQLDSGFVEVASHSRTHPPTPYADPIGEVMGSSEDIKNGLSLPPLFTMGGTKYVYTWIAPYGDFDATVDSLTGVAGYIAERLYANMDTTGPREYYYGDSTLSAWDGQVDHFQPFMPTVELGAPSWGGGDTSVASLNGLFDTILAKGDVYHCMWHPQVLYPDKDARYLHDHLQYISNRSNIWYVNLGHLYLYTLMRESVAPTITSVASANSAPQQFTLWQNYPNPFNPTTRISFSVDRVGAPSGVEGPASTNVRLVVYDILGRELAVLADGRYPAGKYTFSFDGTNLASGVYLYRLTAGAHSAARKMLLLR